MNFVCRQTISVYIVRQFKTNDDDDDDDDHVFIDFYRSWDKRLPFTLEAQSRVQRQDIKHQYENVKEVKIWNCSLSQSMTALWSLSQKVD